MALEGFKSTPRKADNLNLVDSGHRKHGVCMAILSIAYIQHTYIYVHVAIATETYHRTGIHYGIN